MKKLFLILLFIVIASYNSHAAVDKNVRCMSFFAKGNASAHINDMIEPYEVKRRLLQQTLYSKAIRAFVVEYSLLIEDLYKTRFAEALDNKFSVNYDSLGFKSPEEAKALKETVISKQIKILSIMDPSDMTPEFAADFKRIATRVYYPQATRNDLIALDARMGSVLLAYSANNSSSEY